MGPHASFLLSAVHNSNNFIILLLVTNVIIETSPERPKVILKNLEGMSSNYGRHPPKI